MEVRSSTAAGIAGITRTWLVSMFKQGSALPVTLFLSYPVTLCEGFAKCLQMREWDGGMDVSKDGHPIT